MPKKLVWPDPINEKNKWTIFESFKNIKKLLLLKEKNSFYESGFSLKN